MTRRGGRRGGRRRVLVGLALAALTLTGCGSAPAAGEDRLVVLAAASLSDVLTELAAEHERSHPGTEVVTSFGGSSALAQQVVAGAPADVLVAASPSAVQVVLDAGAAVGEPVVVARNRLQIAVPAGNPGRVRALADLARPELAVALCAVQVPCGAAAERTLAAAGVQAAPDTLEQDVRAVLAKVRLGEVDAGLVYRTDVLAAGDEVEGLPLPPGADAAVELLLSDDGQEVLGRAGFDRP